MSETIERALQLVDANPNDLIVGSNVRAEAQLDDEFIASVRERGVLEPIVGYYSDDDAAELVVLYGKRRTLAARAAGLSSVPVVVVLEPDEADRLVDQLTENEHRAALSNADRVAAFQQLEAIGISTFEIAKRTATRVDTVGAALEVAASRTAREAAAKHTALTIEQAAAIAEFDADPVAVAGLVEAAEDGRGFDHRVQRLRDDRDQLVRYEEQKAELAEAGLPIVPKPEYNDAKIRSITSLSHKDKPLTEARHRKCPGHAAFLQETWDSNRRVGWAPSYVCTDFPKHGHALLWGGSSTRLPAAEMTDEQREAAKAERRDVIESNKAWDSAQTVRRDWLRTFVTRKVAPKGAAALIAAALTATSDDTVATAKQSGNKFACELLGVKPYTYGEPSELHTAATSAPTEGRAHMIALAVVLAAYEDLAPRDAWRAARPGTARYLRFLQANGYELSEVEERACRKEAHA
jgi:ParB family chromosome partitioning protein